MPRKWRRASMSQHLSLRRGPHDRGLHESGWITPQDVHFRPLWHKTIQLNKINGKRQNPDNLRFSSSSIHQNDINIRRNSIYLMILYLKVEENTAFRTLSVKNRFWPIFTENSPVKLSRLFKINLSHSYEPEESNRGLRNGYRNTWKSPNARFWSWVLLLGAKMTENRISDRKIVSTLGFFACFPLFARIRDHLNSSGEITREVFLAAAGP